MNSEQSWGLLFFLLFQTHKTYILFQSDHMILFSFLFFKVNPVNWFQIVYKEKYVLMLFFLKVVIWLI